MALDYRLTPQDKEYLAPLLSNSHLLEQESIPLWKCYRASSFPNTARHYIECSLEQKKGMEPTFRQIEASLSSHQLWEPLRDFYIRYTHRYVLDAPLRKEAQQKALLLSLQVAPHPTHALQLLLDSLSPSTANHSHNFTQIQMEWAIRLFNEHGWSSQLDTLLQALSRDTENLSSTQYKQMYQLLPFHTLHSQTELLSARDEPKAFLQSVHEYQQKALTEQDHIERRKYQIRAVLQLSASHEFHQQAADYWFTILSDPLPDPILWQQLYEVTVPSQRWELLSLTLRLFSPSEIVIPESKRLRLPLLDAFEQGLVPELDGLPFLLHAFQQQPGQHKRFRALISLLRERKLWYLLRRVVCTYLSHQHQKMQGPLSQNQLPTHHADLLTLLGILQNAEDVPHEESFSAHLQAIAFFPHEHGPISSLARWSQTQPPTHTVHQILKQLAIENRGGISFRLHIAQQLALQTESQAQSTAIYTNILAEHPHHTETIQQARRLAMMQQAYEVALNLFDRELELQTEPIALASLWLQKAELLLWQLQRPSEAQTACQKAIRATPQNIQALQMMAELLEQQNQIKELLPILGQLLLFSPSLSHKLLILHKILRYALYPLQDHEAALRALDTLLPLPQTMPECFDAFEQLLQLPEAQLPLLTFLIEREDKLNEPHRSRIKLLIIRLMFALLRFQEAKSRLRHFLHHAKSSLLLLQETEEVAIQHHSWRELSQIIEQQIELLQSNPYPSLSISSLYVQLGDLHEQILNAPNQAQAAYRNALLYNPNDEHALDRIHTMLAKKGAFNECRELLLTQATQTSNNHASELYVRAALLELNKLHHLDAAYNLLQQALELYPHNTKALELIASLEQTPEKL